MCKKKNINEIKQYCNKYGYEVLSTKYINAHTKLKFKCNKGHVYEARWNCFQRGQRCPFCHGNIKYSYDFVKKYVEQKSYKLISKVYKNIDTKLKFKCDKGHIYKTSFYLFKKGHRCPKCMLEKQSIRLSLDFTEILDRLRSVNMLYLRGKYNNQRSKLTVRCLICGDVQIRTLNSIMKHGCSSCKKKGNKNKLIKTMINRVNIYCNSINYKWDGCYIDAHTPLKLVCNKNHDCLISWNNLYNGKRCNHCNIFKNEEECRKIFENITNKKFPKKRPKWLINPKTNNNLELDGYCEELKIAFEYDGEQHFNPVNWLGGKDKMIKTNKNDKIKNKICEKYGILLIRIPYFIENREKYIKNILKLVLINTKKDGKDESK